jgi:hypothetical protein
MNAKEQGRRHRYSVYGLEIESDLPLPELLSGAPDKPSDVSIELSSIAVSGNFEPGVHPVGGGALLVVDGGSRYFISEGRRILVERRAAMPERNLRLFLLGSALGLLLHQRELLPLHANAVEIRGRAVAFMGASGQGKSTLAAWFHDQAFPLIADDVCLVRMDECGRAWAVPGMPRLKLWRETLEMTGREPDKFERLWEGDEEWEKYNVPVRTGALTQVERELAAIYVLGQGEYFGISRLGGAEATRALMENTYRGQYVVAAGQPRLHWQACVNLALKTPIFKMSREWGLTQLEAQSVQLLSHVTEVLDGQTQGG